MVYLWCSPSDFKNKNIGEYNRKVSPNRFLLKEGRKLNDNEFSSIPIVDFVTTSNQILKFDCLPHSALVPLVNNRVKSILEQYAPNDVEFFSAELVCKDCSVKDFYFVNVINLIKGIDHQNSIYTKMQQDDAICGIDSLFYKNEALGECQLARDEEYHGLLVVSEKIKTIFDKEKITGVWLARPEEFYKGPLTAEDLINDSIVRLSQN